MRYLRLINLGLTAFGACVFGAIFLYLTIAPKDFSQRAREVAIAEVAIAEVSDRFGDTMVRLGQGDRLNRLSDFSQRFSERLEVRMERMRTELANGIDIFVANILTAASLLSG